MEKGDILPVEEMLSEDEFTDRVEILRELEEWYCLYSGQDEINEIMRQYGIDVQVVPLA